MRKLYKELKIILDTLQENGIENSDKINKLSLIIEKVQRLIIKGWEEK